MFSSRPTSADQHAERIKQREAEALRMQGAADPYAPATPRNRLESFRAQQANQPDEALTPRRRLDSFRQQQGMPASQVQPRNSAMELRLPTAAAASPLSGAMPSIPSLGLGRVPDGTLAGGGGLGTDRPLSTRRLKKELLQADSSNAEDKSAGHVTLTDSQGTPRAVRVVQQQELEDFNMVNVKWVWSFEGMTHQIVLRHGRKSGIRKIYVDKTLIERTKHMTDRFIDRGSHHVFTIQGRQAEISIIPGKSATFRYALSIDAEEIERDLSITAPGLSADIGTHFVRPHASTDGFGMTLANCGNRRDGVVVIELEPGLPAHACGLLVGDVVLSVDEVSVVDTNVILDKLANAKGEVTLEVSGSSPSRLVVVPNPFVGKTNGELQLSDTSCGVGVYVSGVTPAADAPRGTGRLELGDVILSVDGAVTESARETIKYMQRGPARLTFVLAGRSIQ